jgi:hypothetical protein
MNCKLSEKQIQALDSELPNLAAKAGRAAYQRALEVTGKVTKAQGDRLVVVKADGSTQDLGQLPRMYKVTVRNVMLKLD